MPSPQMQAIAALCGFTGSDLTKFTSFCKTHSGPQLEETFLGRRIIFFLVVWNESHSAPSGYGHSFHLLIWIVFTVQDDVVVTFYILVLWMHMILRISLFQLFFPFRECLYLRTQQWHCIYTARIQTHFITENTGKSVSEQSCNLCKWNLSNFPFPYWLVLFSWSLLP